MKDNKVFKHYIEYIRFPCFKNMEENTKITFDFPLTVFVGQNGCGKSSSLKGIYGAPDGKSVGEFWFETEVDPIIENGVRNCLIYSYYNEEAEKSVEIIKTRIKKAKNPDYWEPSRPVKEYDMEAMPILVQDKPLLGRSKTRWKGLKKNVILLDFKGELSAFDKYFYFGSPTKRKTIKTKQDYLRKYSKSLKKIIDTKDTLKLYHKTKNKKPHDLNDVELKCISDILGKTYSSGTLIHHTLFEDWGDSVIFETEHGKYSEAFAGSGESAIVKIVHEILKATKYSLILLDEPEVSLFPGAQKRLKYFLLEQCKSKQLQIIIATHSPVFVEDLPSSAIKVFKQQPSGKAQVYNNNHPEDAFYALEYPNHKKIEIRVEDKLAKEIVEAILSKMDENLQNSFNIGYSPGGETILKQNFITTYSHDLESNKYILFDGDCKREHTDIETLNSRDKSIENLKKLIKRQTNIDITFPQNSNHDKDTTVNSMLNYLNFYYKHVFYLPCKTPEEIIWNDERAISLIESDQEVLKLIESESNFKLKFKHVTDKIKTETNATTIFETQSLFIKKFIDKETNSTNYTAIESLIRKIKDHNQSSEN